MSLCANSAFSIFEEHAADVPVWEKQSGVQVFLVIYGLLWTGLSKTLRNVAPDGQSGGDSKGKFCLHYFLFRKKLLVPGA